MPEQRQVLRILHEQDRTVASVARALGVDRRLLWQLVNITQRPEQPMLGRLAIVLNVPVSTLVDEDGRWL